jgi:hypothetical protein
MLRTACMAQAYNFRNEDEREAKELQKLAAYIQKTNAESDDSYRGLVVSERGRVNGRYVLHLLGLRYQQTGGNDNTWGELLNTDVFDVLELADRGMATHAVTGGSARSFRHPLVEQVHKFTGVLTSNETVTIPNLQKRMTVWNATSGSFYLLIKTASGTAVCIPQGTMKDVFCDGSNGVYRADKDDVGKIEMFAGTTAPSGTLECDGTAVKRAKAPDLYAKLGTTWGAGNGSTISCCPTSHRMPAFCARARLESLSAPTRMPHLPRTATPGLAHLPVRARPSRPRVRFSHRVPRLAPLTPPRVRSVLR